tara:strand:+ start:15131 stop:15517 length:387 start_codon:yes stop_codon:yes gene_type:complete
MARTLYKMNIDVRVINHPVETTGSIMWYTDYVVMETADRTVYLDLNKDLSLTLTKGTSTQKKELLARADIKERMDAEKVRAIRDKYSVDQELKMARTPDSDTSKAMATDIAAIVKEVDDWWDAEFNIG